MLYPMAIGPLSAMHRLAYVIMEDESKKRFICYRCLRIRQLTRMIIFALFFLLVTIVLLLEKYNFID